MKADMYIIIWYPWIRCYCKITINIFFHESVKKSWPCALCHILQIDPFIDFNMLLVQFSPLVVANVCIFGGASIHSGDRYGPWASCTQRPLLLVLIFALHGVKMNFSNKERYIISKLYLIWSLAFSLYLHNLLLGIV